MREFNALCRRRRHNEENDTYRTASIIATIYNVNRGKGQDPLRPEDFMSGKKKPKQTAEEMLAFVKSIHSQVGGNPPEV
jgi:hypothetical protein